MKNRRMLRNNKDGKQLGEGKEERSSEKKNIGGEEEGRGGERTSREREVKEIILKDRRKWREI
jgi:hypothetical protein